MPRFLAAQPDSRLITLPWATPLAEWPEENLVALPRGISRHVVRFVRVDSECTRSRSSWSSSHGMNTGCCAISRDSTLLRSTPSG